jgi:hypothetical protein
MLWRDSGVWVLASRGVCQNHYSANTDRGWGWGGTKGFIRLKTKHGEVRETRYRKVAGRESAIGQVQPIAVFNFPLAQLPLPLAQPSTVKLTFS